MSVVQGVPADLAAMPPGPELAAVLAGIDPARVCNGDVVEVLRACARQRAHTEAQMFALVADVGCRDPLAPLDDVGHLAAPGRYCADELRPALTWTRRKSEAELEFAWALTRILPSVFEALHEARIDLPKARIFCTYLADLPPDERLAICVALLPKAGGWTAWKLADQLRRIVIGTNPKRAEALYQEALAKGAVVGYIDANGTAALTAHGLPPEDMAACFTNISQLARAIRRAGHPAPLDWLRVRLLCGLTDSTLHMLTREQIIAHFLRDTPQDEVPLGKAPGVEVRAEVSTLLGRDEHAGELPAWGPILPGNARETVFGQRGGRWCFAVCDQDGHLISAGITRQRPACTRSTRQGGAVELQIPETLLAELAANPPEGWEKVIADIAAQHEAWPEKRALLDSRPEGRFPSEALRRYNRTRDRHCQGPGCQQTASRCEFDHTVDHQYGGPTTDANGGQFCWHDHDLKTRGGWTFSQPEPGMFVGRSPLGQTYRTQGGPVITPMPRPPPEDEPRF